MFSPRFFVSSLSLHVVLIGMLVFFAGTLPRTFPPKSKPGLEAYIWTQPKKIAQMVVRSQKLGDKGGGERSSLAENMQGKFLKSSFSRMRRRMLGQGKVKIEDALYLDSWKRKIEATGNLNYPAEARRLGLTGSLRLRVLLNQEGNIVEATLLSSSGENILDEAALKILHLASPFAPFPPAMCKEVEVLEIERTWQFLGSREVLM